MNWMPSRVGRLQGLPRKIFHACLFEFAAIVLVTLLTWTFSGQGMGAATGLAITCSVTALVWNMVFNSLFESWERRQPHRTRTVARRVAHTIGFEGGLVILTVPLFAWWLQVDWWTAFMADLGLMVFFLFYTFTFNWLFDHVFGLPASAAAVPGGAP